MRGFAFLAAGAQPRFRSMQVLSPDELVDAVDDELWWIEDGRPVERISGWDDHAAREFTVSCVRSACAHALGHPAEGSLAELERRVHARLRTEPTETLAYAADAFAMARGRRPDEWDERPLAGLGVPSPATIAANLGFVVAHVAGYAAASAGGDPAAYDEGFSAERSRQRAWLAERLRLTSQARA
jgi:hypothetical protein